MSLEKARAYVYVPKLRRYGYVIEVTEDGLVVYIPSHDDEEKAWCIELKDQDVRIEDISYFDPGSLEALKQIKRMSEMEDEEDQQEEKPLGWALINKTTSPFHGMLCYWTEKPKQGTSRPELLYTVRVMVDSKRRMRYTVFRNYYESNLIMLSEEDVARLTCAHRGNRR